MCKQFVSLSLLGGLLAMPGLATAQTPVLADASHLRVTTTDAARLPVDSRLLNAGGEVEIIIRLADPSLAAAQTEGARKTGSLMSPSRQREHLRNLSARQSSFLSAIKATGARELARFGKAHNAVAVRVNASQIPTIAALPGVTAVRPVVNYQLDLSETVPYIGAAAAQAAGVNGAGVRVAVVDSGIDYTHKNLGGEGTYAAYEAAYGVSTDDPLTTTRDGLFPTAKVVEGYDFVGEVWPDGDLAPDEDPIDFGAHGTHVADIIGGASIDGTHKGVAPGVSLLAVKACSAIATSCSGVALLQAMDYVLDPNGDGDISDAVDVVNLSLGSSYGQREDDLSEACAAAVRLGVVVVASAGNSADRPYITGSPASTPEVISVAETQVPSAGQIPLVINSPATIAGSYANTATLDWAAVDAVVTGDVVYIGRGCPGDALLADPAGKIALIDRGACAVSLKVDVAADAGATGVLIGLVAAGDAIKFSYGGGDTLVPTLVIIRSYASLIKNSLAGGAVVNVTISPDNAIPLVGSVVNSSARGPSYSRSAIKPDIGAPGASLSAEAGYGDLETAFGGTSGAAPMISGAAALLVQAYPHWTPQQIKAALMNSAETAIYTNPALAPGELAPITRIGSGEVRVDRSLAARTGAWALNGGGVGLSFGYDTATKDSVQVQFVAVKNNSRKLRFYCVNSSFRYADDAGSGAVNVWAPPFVIVPPHSTRLIPVLMKVDASKLPDWTLDGGFFGGSGPLLQTVEFDGYLHITDGDDNIHLPWHVLPHKAADIKTAGKKVNLKHNGTGKLKLKNHGAAHGPVDVFSWTGSSGHISNAELPGPGDNFAVIDINAVGARLVAIGGTEAEPEFGLQVAVNTFGQRAHPNYPAEFDVYFDVDQDGFADYVIFNSELGGFAGTGQNVVSVFDFSTGLATPYFYTDADLNSANIILTAPLEALGLTPEMAFDFEVYAFDNYFTGNLTDAVGPMTYTLGIPRYFGFPLAELAPNAQADLDVLAVPGGEVASPSQAGLLLMYRHGKLKNEAVTIEVKP